jgi:hypothetical protein
MGTEGILIGEPAIVRTLLLYTGTVNSCTVKLWLRNRETGVWYEGPTTDELDPLTPGGAAPVNEVRDWSPGGGSEVFFQVTAISGGGTVTVRVLGVQR